MIFPSDIHIIPSAFSSSLYSSIISFVINYPQCGDSQGTALPQHVWSFPHFVRTGLSSILAFKIKPFPPEIILRTLPLHSEQLLRELSFIDWLISNFLPHSLHKYSYMGMMLSFLSSKILRNCGYGNAHHHSSDGISGRLPFLEDVFYVYRHIFPQ
jgi:hypothetical protein